MRPLQLTMQAFGSYGEKTTIDFRQPSQRLFLITGDTGAGKSTIFDAICFALYGEASSTAYAKTGVILQSQFVSTAIEPFVSLRFSDGEDGAVYEIRRVPRHLRPAGRRTKSGASEILVSSSAELTMPDGTVYPSRETDRKLEELVGLTKEQFTQIAMIAQGEFMALLRAKSDEKKVIFRRLFGTGIYQAAAEELRARLSAKEKEAEELQTQCRQLAASAVVPEEGGEKAELSEAKRRLEEGELSALPDFVRELRALCGALRAQCGAAQERVRTMGEQRDAGREALIRAQQTEEAYGQLERSERELAACREAAEEMKNAEALIARIRAAQELAAERRVLAGAEAALAATETALAKEQALLPEKSATAETAERAAAGSKERYDGELAEYSRRRERVERAERQFAAIQSCETEEAEREKTLNGLRLREEGARKRQAELEEEARLLRDGIAAGEQVPVLLSQWEEKCRTEAALERDITALAKREGECREAAEAVCAGTAAYAEIREESGRKAREYEAMLQSFLDAQAGFLAEQLRPGKPCPVCGSTEHPHPFRPDRGGSSGIRRETVDAAREEAERLRAVQEKRAGELRAAQSVKSEKEKSLASGLLALREAFQRALGGFGDDAPEHIPDVPDVRAAQRLAARYRELLMREGKRLREQNEALLAARERLTAGEREMEELDGTVQKLREALQEAALALQAARARSVQLREGLEFSSAEEVRRYFEEASRRLVEAKTGYEARQAELAAARKAQNECGARISRLLEELPEQRRTSGACRLRYEEKMREKRLDEEEWQSVFAAHAPEDADRLQKTLTEYLSRKAVAERAKEEAAQRIGGRERPVTEELRRQSEENDRALGEAEERFRLLDREYRRNEQVLEEIAPKLARHSTALSEYRRLRTLYRLISGTESGNRMDLETFAQRCRLEKILHAANRRFREMSAGQFELRLYDIEKAGEGKNRGLDLMVYSTVTGRLNEVRSLSGGESFMAALSLALGMADQIETGAAGLHLEIMFIDEGFGSLSDNARNQAVRVLQEMAEGSKLIGIISHVSELKQQIEDQLIITKDERGSHARWQLS
ncbi:AAA family ATPase [Lachnoclostridium sp. Marseille-P6806]|uniref:AAA family ATPase n=1 Tax=Lachnoclostridium sp. Marseille-P6806 TaxID=2364793 RepID=UPI00102F3B07|nr:AAA family ATPase [Lachnoclostridium sp. Marseille-P6806]